MTAPDSRDSVEKIVAEMVRIAPTCENDWDEQLRDWADRLQALARGPQQAGGEDGFALDVALDRAAIAEAEVARLKEVCIDFPGIGEAGPFDVVARKVILPPETMADLAHHFRMGCANKDAERYQWLCERVDWKPRPDGFSGVYLVATMVSAVYGDCKEQVDAAIDAALNGGQDDA